MLSAPFADKESCLESAYDFALGLLHVIKQTYIIEGHHLYISASVGVSIIDNPNITANTLIKEADIAMYEAKAAQK